MKISKLIAFLMLLVVSVGNIYSQVIPYTDEEKMMFEHHYNEMSFGVKIASEDEFSRLVDNYNVAIVVQQKLVNLILEREWKKAALNYSGFEPTERYRHKVALDSVYQRFIDVELMPDNDIAGTVIMCALKMKKEIKMSDSIFHKITNDGLDIAYRRRINPSFNSLCSEMKVLKSYLNSKQIHRVLREKNKDAAWEKSWDTWKDVLANDLASKKDSAKLCREMTGYYLNKLVYSDMYCDDNRQKISYLSSIDESKPEIIGKLDLIIEKKKLLMRRNNNKNTNYQW